MIAYYRLLEAGPLQNAFHEPIAKSGRIVLIPAKVRGSRLDLERTKSIAALEVVRKCWCT